MTCRISHPASSRLRLPVPLERASGNYVVLDLGEGRFAFYEHLRQGSIVVRAGERVRRGQTIAQLGSSGSTSIGPHLHFHVADANAALAAEGLPFVIRRFEHLGAYQSLDALRDREPWAPAAPGRAGARRLEHPAPVAVRAFLIAVTRPASHDRGRSRGSSTHACP